MVLSDQIMIALGLIIFLIAIVWFVKDAKNSFMDRMIAVEVSRIRFINDEIQMDWALSRAYWKKKRKERLHTIERMSYWHQPKGVSR